MSRSGEYETILIREEENLAWLILNRPEKLNTLTPKLLEEFSEALETLDSKDSVKVIAVTGAGRAFSAGADINMFKGQNPFSFFKLMRKIQEVFNKLELIPKPIIAAINGYALGGGLELAMACDIRIASESAKLGQPEINIGFIPGAGGTQRLTRLVPGRAKEFLFTGDHISAREAERIGLLNKVVPPEQLQAEVKSMADKLARRPPLAVAMAKYASFFGKESSIWAGLVIEASAAGMLASTEDFVEGVTAFLEKREAKFKGK